MFSCYATNPSPRVKLRARQDKATGRMHVRIGSSVLNDVTTTLELIVLAACRGGYRPVGQPDKVIRL